MNARYRRGQLWGQLMTAASRLASSPQASPDSSRAALRRSVRPVTANCQPLAALLPQAVVRPFTPGDAAELVVLQRCCCVSEAIQNDTLDIPALHETADDVLDWTTTWTTLTVRHHGRLVAGVRGRLEGTSWQIGRLMVAPDFAGRGIGTALLATIEAAAPRQVEQFVLFTGGKSVRNIRTYERAGYRLTPTPSPMPPGHIVRAVYMTKPAATDTQAGGGPAWPIGSRRDARGGLWSSRGRCTRSSAKRAVRCCAGQWPVNALHDSTFKIDALICGDPRTLTSAS